MAIERFRGDYFFLSSMYPVEHYIELPDGRSAPTVEHIYQASKFMDERAQDKILAARDGVKAKDLAHHLEESEKCVVQPFWSIEKVDIMRNLVWQKYAKNSELKELLLETGDEEIIEGNTWHDTFWGVSPPGSDVGLNWLGRIHMETRARLREQEQTEKKPAE